MPTGTFWAVLDAARPPSGAVQEHADAITDELVSRGIDATIAWSADLDAALDALDHWDLWGAGYLALGGCSDDAYEYLRCWIVARGQGEWERACGDPEGYVVGLFDGIEAAEDVQARLEELAFLDGEALRYAAGVAHERLTGSWLPPRDPPSGARPRGAPWDEDDLPRRLPRLAAQLPSPASADGPPSDESPSERLLLLEVFAAHDQACAAFEAGDHGAAARLLASVMDDPERWALLGRVEGAQVDAAYAGGVSRLILGDPDGAAAWLRRVSEAEMPPHVRRALAQIEIARGALEEAAALLDQDPSAPPFDRTLRMVVAFRTGDRDAARREAMSIAQQVESDPEMHPWNAAGVYVQIGLVLVELGDSSGAATAADTIEALTQGAPDELPLLGQGQIVRAGAARLAGDRGAARAALERANALLPDSGCDRGLAEREEARLRRAEGRTAAAAAYEASIAFLRAAGEPWLADETAAEAAEPARPS